MTSYPPEPWRLRGEFLAGIFLVTVAELPAHVWAEIPPGARPVTLAGRAIVAVAAVRYTPGGVLAYDELLVAVPTIRRGRLAVTIPQIWVTSPASAAGGQALWGIPKDLMATRRAGAGRRLRVRHRAEDRAVLAEVDGTATVDLPGIWTLPLPTLQRRPGGGAIRSSNSVRGRLHLARTTWTFGSSLSWLGGRRPALSAALTGAAIVFGTHVER